MEGKKRLKPGLATPGHDAPLQPPIPYSCHSQDSVGREGSPFYLRFCLLLSFLLRQQLLQGQGLGLKTWGRIVNSPRGGEFASAEAPQALQELRTKAPLLTFSFFSAFSSSSSNFLESRSFRDFESLPLLGDKLPRKTGRGEIRH